MRCVKSGLAKLPSFRFGSENFFFSKVTLFNPHFVTALWYTHTPVPLAILNQDSSGVVFVEAVVCAFASPPSGVVERQKQAERSDRITQTGRSLSLAGESPSARGTTTSTTPSTCTSTTSTTASGKAGRRSCLAPFPVCSTRFMCRWGVSPYVLGRTNCKPSLALHWLGRTFLVEGKWAQSTEMADSSLPVRTVWEVGEV